MKKHMEALEKRRAYLESRLSNDHPAYGTILDGELLKEKEALDWALGKLEADPEIENICPWTGMILSEAVKEEEAEKPKTTGHFGPVYKGDTVETKIDVRNGGLNPIAKGEVGTVIGFDRWLGEEYPYVVSFSGGHTAAFARDEIRKVS